MSSLGKRSAGFTLTELIIVILLIAIMSAYAASKYSGPSQFSVYAAQEQAISVIRQIQLGRMQSNLQSLDYAGPQGYYRLSVTSNCLSSEKGCLNDLTSNSVYIEDQGFTFSPSMKVEFDLLGKPICQPASGCSTPTGNQLLTINISNGVESAKVCINSEGFVYSC